VTFNGRGYDGPVLMIRSAQLGLRPSRQLVGYRYDLSDHCDLSEVFSFHGSTRENFKLDYWCRRFDVESPKGGLDGSQVGRAYRDGRIEDIGTRDVRGSGAPQAGGNSAVQGQARLKFVKKYELRMLDRRRGRRTATCEWRARGACPRR
jgi:hypothetical protein